MDCAGAACGLALGSTEVSYHVDARRRLITIDARQIGPWCIDLRHARRIETDPLYDERFAVLIDLSTVRGVPDTDLIWEVADLYLRLAHGAARGPWAVVVGSPGTFGMTRMFEILTNQPKARLRVFQARESALDWLTDIGSSRFPIPAAATSTNFGMRR